MFQQMVGLVSQLRAECERKSLWLQWELSGFERAWGGQGKGTAKMGVWMSERGVVWWSGGVEWSWSDGSLMHGVV
jgi:hypothetical protein